MKNLMIWVVCLLCSTHSVKAQGFLDKLDRTLNKVERTGNKVENSTEKAGRIGGSLGNLLGKKGEAPQVITVSIEGIKLADLKALSTSLESEKQVGDVKLKFQTKVSSIEVQYKGESDALFELLKKANPKITDESVQAIEEDSISIKL